MMILMSDSELENIKRKKLRELQEKLTLKEKKNEEVDADQVLNKVFKDRAWEVFNAACVQFPEARDAIKGALVKTVLSGRLNEINGEQLYFLLRSLGLRVRLNTEIRFIANGKMKSIAEKLKEDP